MGLFGQSFPADGAKGRFARLHFQAACVRLEMLSRILKGIEERGGVEQAPPAILNEAAIAAAEVAENLRWAYERMRETALEHEADGARMDFPPGRGGPEVRSGAKEEGKKEVERGNRRNVKG